LRLIGAERRVVQSGRRAIRATINGTRGMACGDLITGDLVRNPAVINPPQSAAQCLIRRVVIA